MTMADPRTPKNYYVSQDEYDSHQNSLERLRTKLDDLVTALNSYKEKRGMSPAAKKIVDDEEDKAAQLRYKKRSKENAMRFLDAVLDGDEEDMVDRVKEALDYKALIRVDPYMMETGSEMQEQIFGDY